MQELTNLFPTQEALDGTSAHVRDDRAFMDVIHLPDPQRMIANALALISRYGGIAVEQHHRAWVIDQVLRILLGSPVTLHERITPDGTEMEVEIGTSEAYLRWVREEFDGPDGPATYSWDTGIAP